MRVFLSFFMMCFVAFPVWADDALDNALRATYTACVGIDDELHDMRVMAGINTAVTSVGAAAGVGATTVGLVKASKDKQIEELEAQIQKLIEMENRGDIVPDTDEDVLNQFGADVDASYMSALTELEELRKKQQEVDKLTDQSVKLGNWRTGLIAGTTATNIAGTAIAATNRVKPELEEQVKSCVSAVSNLRSAMMQARITGTDISEAESIVSLCGEFEYVDLRPINKRALGAAISGGVGAATGLIGTITSGVANTDKTRDDNTDAGKQKEKNLNTTANVMSAGATVASITATVFNATQIAAIKKVSTVAEQCAGVLK